MQNSYSLRCMAGVDVDPAILSMLIPAPDQHPGKFFGQFLYNLEVLNRCPPMIVTGLYNFPKVEKRGYCLALYCYPMGDYTENIKCVIMFVCICIM